MATELSFRPETADQRPDEGRFFETERRNDRPSRLGRPEQVVNALFLLLAGLGLADAGILTYTHMSGVQVCSPGTGCAAVLSSPYSRILGVPLSTLGLGVYLAIALFAWRAGNPHQRAESVRWIFRLAVLGNLAAPYLLYLQAVVIGEWCPFCLASTGLMAAVFTLSLWDRIAHHDHRSLLRAPRCRADMKPVLGSLLLPPLLFATADRFILAAESKALAPDATVVAQIGARTITAAEMDHALRTRLHEIEWERYEARREWLEKQLLLSEAERRNLSLDDLVRTEVRSGVSVTTEEIEEYYRAHRDRFARDARRDAIDRHIANQLWKQKSQSWMSRYIAQLKEERGAVFSLSKPVGLALEPNPRGGPESGPDTASVTVVVFSDFECSHCASAHRRLTEFIERHPNKVRVVFRHFPLEMHRNARSAAYVAACAQSQGKFWKYADSLFAHQRDLSESKLYEYAAEAGLDVVQLRQCVESGQGRTIVEADMMEGSDLGLQSTPSLFINGRYFAGLPSDEQLEALLDD